MGVTANVGADKFPTQGHNLGRRCMVVFNYDLTRRFPGVIVRDDITAPHLTIIGLDDGRYVLATECQYQVEAG